ncbi:hypothetical protein PVK06_043387 [Gossypium arboreum]|uniref:Uncharacterized protein n=1 Tax=Gossypium arboreum TaxID=29729 RepID=A0ABR0MNC2_GOSAR|nr:hypothetical protein PVK06_043387 [Gossypium arboreum]
MGAPTDSALDLDEQILQLMQCKPLSEQQSGSGKCFAMSCFLFVLDAMHVHAKAHD